MGIPAPEGVSASGLPNALDQASVVVPGTFAAVGPGDPFAFRGAMDLAIWASFNATLTTTNGSLAASVSSAGAIAAGAAVNSVNVPPGTTWATFSGTSGTLALPAVTHPGSSISISGNKVTLPPGSNVAALLGATVTTPSNNEQVTLPAGTVVASIFQTDIAPTRDSPGRTGIIELSAIPTVAPVAKYQAPLRFQLGPAAIATGVDANAVFTGWAIVYTGSVQIETSWDGFKTWIVGNLGSITGAVFSAGTPLNVRFGEPERFVGYRLNCTAYTSVSGVTLNYRFSQTGGANESLAIGPLIGG